MSEFKEVWYVWCDTAPMPKAEKVLSVLQHGARGAWDTDDAREHGFLGINWDSIAAYTLGQKRRRVKCGCKDGVFYMTSVEGGYYEPHPCNKCNGTGFKKGEWEYKQGVE